MSELNHEYEFHPADLIDYAIDKPIGAARAALTIALEKTDIDPDLVSEELSENMELNQLFLKQISNALRNNKIKIISDMPKKIKVFQMGRGLSL